MLIDLLERLMVHMAQVPSTALTSPGRQDSALQEHRAMVKAISKRDAVTARDITR
ncbi:FCD domain-containing protein [Corynebacterium striatum]|uniref:FCD domain-containing protein n=1 Tax=Corynebacterium TaxID=1716 RepID=UPI0009B9698D|nr:MULTISPECIES: FCD domain-containing protein [Corynebacterium]ATZ05196.1 FCD domain-containing protein [Corynebacterium striatum]KAA1272129.1 FCD domain-containing protein [Corynebacterium striatum]MBD0856706.1 FCD domain-containing protein [Corynebacterium striatum]MCG7250773.1 FCD domain-containing protein [Corynebacterium striatum]MDC7105949.1 FCD domain-containing protein [Corynebacterium striatum]